jgi:hypothetical protein
LGRILDKRIDNNKKCFFITRRVKRLSTEVKTIRILHAKENLLKMEELTSITSKLYQTHLNILGEGKTELEFINSKIEETELSIREIRTKKRETEDDLKRRNKLSLFLEELKERKRILDTERKVNLILENLNTENQTILSDSEEKEKPLPYKIALLQELGFFELDKIKKLTKENKFKVIQKLTGGTHRTIKGNVNVLNYDSNEDRAKYTSNNYTDEVKNYLDKLK